VVLNLRVNKDCEQENNEINNKYQNNQRKVNKTFKTNPKWIETLKLNQAPWRVLLSLELGR
jgi:hypothetical protein